MVAFNSKNDYKEVTTILQNLKAMKIHDKTQCKSYFEAENSFLNEKIYKILEILETVYDARILHEAGKLNFFKD